MNTVSKIFITPIREEITNFKTGEICHLVSNEKEETITEADYKKITAICNQSAVYNFLFKEKLKDQKYGIENATKFVNWIIDGWKKQEWFVFFVRNIHEEIIAAIDIKSNNLESAEIGCWADENNTGIMTNATLMLLKIASKSGFKKLFAIIKPNNTSSQNVVKRCGFIFDGEITKDNNIFLRFYKQLN